MRINHHLKPVIEAIPERARFADHREQTVDLLLRITPPASAAQQKRPRLNLSLVLDRSGSMRGEKMARAREAAAFCVDQLMAEDRLSVVIFDDRIEVIVPSQPIEDKAAIKERIQRVQARNSTALHEAWVRGGLEVSGQLASDAINRVILITDGLANVGETNVDRIVTQAGALAGRNVTTSTIGIGSDFNEDLLIPMAEAGRGNAWHVERADDMARIFATELQGLVAQVGHTASLGLTPVDGVTVKDVLNDFEVTHTGRYKLPNLLAGSPIEAVVRVKLPARKAGEQFKALDVRLAWTPQGAPSSEREVLNYGVFVEFADAGEADALPADERVIKAVQLLMVARARREAINDLDRGDFTAARSRVQQVTHAFADACAPIMADAEVQEQMEMLADLEAELQNPQEMKMSRKKLSYQSYSLARQSKRLK
ncbi:MAG TPA: VWA domain-containing protein [Blastocatellia bacterium]|nr:VWA domain-containing protein [Blastocatellia bacterium]